MSDDNRRASRGGANRRFASIFLGAIAVLGAVFVAFLIFYTVAEPERTANPADISDQEVPDEGVGVPDGGDLTNVPTQAAPDSPARAIGDPDNEN